MTEHIRHEYAPGEMRRIYDHAIAEADRRIDALVQAKSAEFSTIEGFEQALADLGDAVDPLLFMMNVHTDARVREEAKEVQELFEKHGVRLYTRKDIYRALKAAQGSARTHAQRRLAEKHLRSFRRSGAELPDAQLDEIRRTYERLAEIRAQFEHNLNTNTDTVPISEEEAQGLPQSFLERVRTAEGIRVSTNVADVAPFMKHCKSPVARKRMLEKYENKEAAKNTPLLAEAIRLRMELARMLGYATWADYSTEVKMSKNAANVMSFLDDLRMLINRLHRDDLLRLEQRKQQDHPGERLQPWDITYYDNILREQLFHIDSEAMREYFPAEHVVARMFAIYGTLFGVEFSEVPVRAWAPEVRCYEVRERGALVGTFYTDFFPRNGKYNHFAAVSLRDARFADGKWRTPIAAIMCNFTPPTQHAPSLLTHDEVETLFHEFGHIMHTLLSKAEYASLSAFRTAVDFVEAPSQMLENWTWDAQMLASISKHYKTGEPLPPEMIARMAASRHFNEGYYWTRQILFSVYDMRMHMEAGLDPIATYRTLYKEITGLEPVPGTHWPATWGHIMDGYDAGYYGYTWSKVYAQDMFTSFTSKLLDPHTGKAYREQVLAPGDLEDADVLMKRFLGREPNNKAFLTLIGIH